MQEMTFPISFCLPASEVYGAGAPSLRAFGDPGTTEQFALPKYAYIFLVFNLKNDRPADIRYFEWKNEDAITDDDDFTWEEVQVSSAAYGVNEGDLIRVCNKKITEQTPVLGQVESCHLYAAVSDVALTLKNGATTIDASHVPTTEAAVQGITFTVNDALQPHLQNIYSTPYNYQPDGSHYYCSLNIWRDAPTYNIMLYHVASKVDLMWNVPEDKQGAVKVTEVKVKNLFEGDAYLFKHTANTHTMFTGEGAEPNGYTPATSLAGNVAGDVAGTWWAGRAYLYTIPYKAIDKDNRFPVQVDFSLKNVSADVTYTKSLTLTMTPPEVFAPWLRMQFTVSSAPTANSSETKNLD